MRSKGAVFRRYGLVFSGVALVMAAQSLLRPWWGDGALFLGDAAAGPAQMKFACKFISLSSTAFVKFLALANAEALKDNAQDPGAPEIAMLNTLTQSWLAGVPPNVLAIMRANVQCCPSVSHAHSS